jgi:hypothetical protein
MEHTLSVAAILDRLGHEELMLKQLGAFGPAEGVRISIVQILRLADADLSTNDKQSLEPT